MAKELPYFKFEPSQWENGNIQMCTHEEQGIFISLCSVYWQRLGDLSYRFALIKICGGNESILKSLIYSKVIKLDDDSIRIDFLDNQLEEFKIISKRRAEAGKKGGENRVLAPEIARIKGSQIYVIRCFNESEEFIKIGITSESISRRFSGKMPYSYEVLLQFSTEENLDLESTCNDILYNEFSYLPKIQFTGYLECYEMAVLPKLKDIVKHRTGFDIAMPKQSNAIREDKIREDKIREEESKTLDWFKNQIDGIYRNSLEITHKGKNIDQAILESYNHVSSDKLKLKNLDGSGAKKLVNTWLSNMKMIQQNGDKQTINLATNITAFKNRWADKVK